MGLNALNVLGNGAGRTAQFSGDIVVGCLFRGPVVPEVTCDEEAFALSVRQR